MSKENIILIGGGGHCKSVIDVIEAEGRFNIAGITDIKEKIGEKVLGYEIIGSDDDLPMLRKNYVFFLVTVGQIKNNRIRLKNYELIKKLKGVFPVIISPYARITRHSEIGEGTIIMHNVIINSDSRIGVNCIINTSSIIEHDVCVGDHCHISTGSVINGSSIVGNNSFVGSNSVISHGISIGKNNIIGAGTVLLRSTLDNCLYVGNPGVLKKTI